jgi:hypothetical protein
MDKNVWHLVTKPSDDGTLGVGNVVKVDDEGFLHCKGAGTLLPDEAMDALEGVEFIKVADIDMEALATVGALVNHFGKMSHANSYGEKLMNYIIRSIAISSTISAILSMVLNIQCPKGQEPIKIGDTQICQPNQPLTF